MTAPRPQSKLNEVYDFLMSFEGMINPNNISLSRWLRDAQALRKSNPAEGFLMEALVYRAQGKLNQAVDCVKKSYQINKTVACNDYTTLLSNAGLFEEAVRLSLTNLQEDNFNAYALNRLITDSFMALNKQALSQGLSLFKDSNNKSVNLLELGHATLEMIDNRLSTLNQVKVLVDDFVWVSSIAIRALNTYYIGASEFSTTVQHNEVGTFLIINQEIPNLDIEDCFVIHDKYTDDLINSDLSFKDYKRIVYNFLPAADDNLSHDDLLAQRGILV